MPAAAALPAIRKPASPPLVKWRDWNSDSLKFALQENRLIFLDVTAASSRDAHVRDETTYSDPAVAKLLSDTFVAIRTDADARPDLALRYQSADRPTAAILIPTGELLNWGTPMSPAALIHWSSMQADAYRPNPSKVAEALRKSAAARLDSVPPAAPSESSARPEDAVWGGFFHGAGRFEKVLRDQIDVKSSWRYVSRFLLDPNGGYYAGQDCELRRKDGSVMEGVHYFAQDEARRAALGMPAIDQRFFAADNGRMAAAVLDEKSMDAQARLHSIKTLDRWWKRGVYEGEVRHQLTMGVQGLLRDQIGLAAGFVAAYEATGDRSQLDRAAALVRAAETRLMDEKSKALFDRPAWHELPEPTDQLLVPAQNREAVALYERLVKDLPVGDPLRERLKPRINDIDAWLGIRAASN
jgi:hypothetical protein